MKSWVHFIAWARHEVKLKPASK